MSTPLKEEKTDTMAGSDSLDFSGLFKLETLVQVEVTASCFYEVGLKRLVALAGAGALEFLYFTPTGDRRQKSCDWDFAAHPIQCMCLEPSGTWLLVASERALLLVPFLPRLVPDGAYDRRWSLDDVTLHALDCGRLAAVAWWLTREAENIAVVAQKSGTIVFYSLDSEAVVKETEVAGGVADVQICVDDSLDLIVLLITGSDNQHWKLVLEHRSVGYNWAREACRGGALRRKEGLMAYIKDSVFPQGSSQESVAVEYSQKPTRYLPAFRKFSKDWSLTVQYVNGRHFITAFDVNDGTLFLESTEERTPSRTLRPRIERGRRYRQALWCQRLVYALTDDAIEVHSANLSIIQEGAPARDTCLWRADLLGGAGDGGGGAAARAHTLSPRAPPAPPPGWREPTFLCDLQLARFALEPCLLITKHGAFLLTTMAEPSEWLVGLIMRGGQGAERAAAALGAPVAALLCAAADMLLSRSKLQPARYLYLLSQSPADGWVARLAVFGRRAELAQHGLPAGSAPLGSAAAAARLYAQLLSAAVDPDCSVELDTECPNLTPAQLEEACLLAAALGTWAALPVYSTQRGEPGLLLSAVGARGRVCRGALRCLLGQRHAATALLEEDAAWLLDFLDRGLGGFDTRLLKRICLWLSPLSEQMRPVLRDLKAGRTNVYTTRLVRLIRTFARLLSELDAREPSPPTFRAQPAPAPPRERFAPRNTVSCGLMHWAASGAGAARVTGAETPVRAGLVGRVVSVACGRHHTVVLTENGVYCAGDNSYGQLGGGAAWGRAAGEAARAGGALQRASAAWAARVVAVAAGHYHSAAVDAGGRLYTWGWGVHGQLGLGSTNDAHTPQLVTRLQGRKVVSAGCGACHTVALLRCGDVWAFGAGVFGQLGGGGRGKSAVPVRVVLPDPIETIAVGYFHNLALSERGALWSWGASPQAVRAAAAHARRAAGAPPDGECAADTEGHLRPALVDAAHCGPVAQISAGWHHSCLLNKYGKLFTWGLNYDGQLGTGDRKPVLRPTEVTVFHAESQAGISCPPRGERVAGSTPAVVGTVACGGDFTVFVNEFDNIYIAGNTHQQSDSDNEKQGSRVIMMKTTRRVIKIPASRSNNKFVFQFVDKFSNLLASRTEYLDLPMIGLEHNPLTRLSDFQNEKLMDEILGILKPWIEKSDVAANPNVAAKLAYRNEMYYDCLKNQLDSVKTVNNYEEDVSKSGNVSAAPQNDIRMNLKREERINTAIKVVGRRIKDIGFAILNEQGFPEIPKDIYKDLPCSCEELPRNSDPTTKKYIIEESKEILASKAAQVLDNAMSVFPASSVSWEQYLGLVKQFFLDNSLPGREMELVLSKYIDGNASMVSSAVMLSEECAGYADVLTPKFYLTMCSKLLDGWG